MNHIEEERISAYLDEELDEIEKIQVEDHLKACLHCKSVYYELKELKALVSVMYQNVEIPVEIEKKIMNKINKKPWGLLLLAGLVIALFFISQPLLLSLGIVTSIIKVSFSIIASIVIAIPFLLEIVILSLFIAIILSLWSLRRLIVSKVI